MLRMQVLAAIGVMALGYAVGCAGEATTAPASGPAVTISGGHETEGRDRGRPVVLVAAGLGVTPEVFREAFSHVKPAPAGEQPDPAQVQRNKAALMGALEKFGVTNERLDEVSNMYRYPPGDPGLWKHKDAVVKVKVADGKVTGFEIVDAGAGYTSTPMVSVAGFPKLAVKVTVHYGKDLTTNGSIESIKVAEAETRPASE